MPKGKRTKINKKTEFKKEDKKDKKEVKKKKEIIQIKNRISTKSISYIILISIFLLSFYIKGITPIKNVFQHGIVGFAADDSVLHMRLVENTIHFFPHRIFFDAFTLYPKGSPLHWGPLFDQMNAFFAIIAGFLIQGGMPSKYIIDGVGAFYPAVLGALVVFPVYVIGKEIMNEKAGLFGAFMIAILPGQFLSRSVLGFTDNHVAEVFYTTLTMMFFIVAIKKAENITFDHWLNRDWALLKVPLVYSIFAGISFGAYLLVWTTGVFFAVVFGIFVLIQYIIDNFRGKSTEYLGIVGTVAYIVAMIMISPYIEISNGLAAVYYSPLHIIVMAGGALIFAFYSLVSRKMIKLNLRGIHYLLFVIGSILILMITLKAISPDIYNATIGEWNSIFEGTSGGGLTVAEASPITSVMILDNFGYNYYLAYFSIIILGYYIIRKSRAEYTLLVVWSFFVLAITQAQNRFAYYYAVNVAILVGILASFIMEHADWKIFNTDNFIECLKKLRVQHILSLVFILLPTIILPLQNPLNLDSNSNSNSNANPFDKTYISASIQSAQYGAISSGYYEWYDALDWMKNNTPVPDLPYYAIYQKPVDNQNYSYSPNDYGVMSWWDYGNIITYWAHRIPNANPFQAGIGGGASHIPGASTFLTALTEEGANHVLEELGINGKPGARYVVSNAYMAYAIQPVFSDWNVSNEEYFTQIQTSQGTETVPTSEYYTTMESRLHILDANSLSRYRLVHESTPNPYSGGGNDERAYKYIYNSLYGGNLTVENSGYAKIFEYLKGAKIEGRTQPNTTVTITNTIKTNIGRMINYSQTTLSNGTYYFIVPYSTLGPIPGQTQFDTKPVGPYILKSEGVSKQIDISEKDVLNGNILTFDLV